jgi:uncharacterized small protein (DUF1192 family)
MDWDEVRAHKAVPIILGEPLAKLSVAELEARIAALESEIGRATREIDAKRHQAAAANALFRN